MSIWSNERTEIATWLSGYLNMVKTWVDKILDSCPKKNDSRLSPSRADSVTRAY